MLCYKIPHKTMCSCIRPQRLFEIATTVKGNQFDFYELFRIFLALPFPRTAAAAAIFEKGLAAPRVGRIDWVQAPRAVRDRVG